jgi:hypothetical protein
MTRAGSALLPRSLAAALLLAAAPVGAQTPDDEVETTKIITTALENCSMVGFLFGAHALGLKSTRAPFGTASPCSDRRNTVAIGTNMT